MTEQDQVEPEMSETDAPVVRMDSLPVITDYRITIPEDPREHYEITGGDLVTITLLLDGERETFNKTVDDKGRVTIPARTRSEHGIEVGDRVDVEMEVE